jgi:hypothetical protein
MLLVTLAVSRIRITEFVRGIVGVPNSFFRGIVGVPNSFCEFVLSVGVPNSLCGCPEFVLSSTDGGRRFDVEFDPTITSTDIDAVLKKFPPDRPSPASTSLR